MQSLFKHVATISVLALPLTACAPTPAENNAAIACPAVYAVYPGWLSEDIPVQDLYWDGFSHIVIAFALPEPDGGLNVAYTDKILSHLGEEAKKRGKKIILSIGGANGYGDAFIQIAQSPSALEKFTGNVSAYIELHNLDGVDIDWEYWTWQSTLGKGGNDPRESRLLVDLLATLRKTLDQSLTLSTDVFAGSYIGDQYLTEIQNHVDHVNLMAFDFTGAWPDSKIKHHADYKTFKKALSYQMERGFSLEKIVIGLPAYGVEFIDGKKDEVVHRAYTDIVRQTTDTHIDINKGRIGNTYFETRPLIQKKTQLAVSQNLHGLFFFDLSLDTQDPKQSLLGGVNETLATNRCTSFSSKFSKTETK